MTEKEFSEIDLGTAATAKLTRLPQTLSLAMAAAGHAHRRQLREWLIKGKESEPALAVVENMAQWMMPYRAEGPAI